MNQHVRDTQTYARPDVLERLGPDAKFAARAAPPPGDQPLEFVMSDATVDRLGDVIEAAGWDLKNFTPDKNPVALFNHKADNVIGNWRDVRVVNGKLLGRLVLGERHPDTPLVNAIRALVEQGILRAVSVGFRPIEREPLNADADKHWGPFRFTKQELLECSLVAVPANPNALLTAKNLNYPPSVLAEIFGKPATQDRPIVRGFTGKPAESLVPKGAKMSTLSQKIQAAQSRVVSLRDKLTELVNKDTLTDEEIGARDEVDNLLKAEQTELEKLERFEKTLAPREPQRPADPPPAAKPLTGEIIDPPKAPAELVKIWAQPKKKIEPADLMFRAMAVGVRSFANRAPVEQNLREMYGRDEALEIVLRTAVSPASTAVAGWAQELTQTVNVGFLDRLIAASIYGPLSNMGQRYDLGRNNQIKIPTRTASQKAAGAWVGEGIPKPVKKLSLTSVSLYPHKLSVICTFTEEMAAYSNPAIENVIRTAMVNDTSEALDGFLIDNVAESITVRPPGLLDGVSPITATVAGQTAMVTDLKNLVGAIVAAGGGTNIAILINPAQALSIGFAQTTTGDFVFSSTDEAGRKFGGRFIVSRSVPAGRVIAVDADQFASVTGDAPRFAVSTEATLHEEDTNPLAIGTAGTPPTIAAPTRSLFQTDSVAIRLSLYVSWKMLRAGMVQTIAAVNW